MSTFVLGCAVLSWCRGASLSLAPSIDPSKERDASLSLGKTRRRREKKKKKKKRTESRFGGSGDVGM
jgi:hypothetical protein